VQNSFAYECSLNVVITEVGCCSLQNTKVRNIRGQLHKSLITTATQKVKARAKEKGLLVPTSLARRAKAKGKAKAVLKAIPKVYALALLLTELLSHSALVML
jgi:hypothetical protein